VGGGLFYWYEWRPSQIRKRCASESANAFFGKLYEACLNKNGLKIK